MALFSTLSFSFSFSLLVFCSQAAHSAQQSEGTPHRLFQEPNSLIHALIGTHQVGNEYPPMIQVNVDEEPFENFMVDWMNCVRHVGVSVEEYRKEYYDEDEEETVVQHWREFHFAGNEEDDQGTKNGHASFWYFATTAKDAKVDAFHNQMLTHHPGTLLTHATTHEEGVAKLHYVVEMELGGFDFAECQPEPVTDRPQQWPLYMFTYWDSPKYRECLKDARVSAIFALTANYDHAAAEKKPTLDFFKNKQRFFEGHKLMQDIRRDMGQTGCVTSNKLNTRQREFLMKK